MLSNLALAIIISNNPYIISENGQRILANMGVTNADPGKIILVQNWAEEFKSE